MKRRSRKTMLLKLGVFLLLGAIVNVAVASASATLLRPHGKDYRGTTIDEVAWFYEIGWPPGRRNLVNPRDFDVDDRHGFGFQQVKYLRGLTKEEFQFIRNECARVDINVFRTLLPAQTNRDILFAVRLDAGWPMASFRMTRWQSIDDIDLELQRQHKAGISADLSNPRYARHVAREIVSPPLPNVSFAVHWAGFLANTMIYFAILCFLLLGPGRLRRFVRIRQHRCPACGFIIAKDTCANGLCSECGARLAWMKPSA